MVGAVRAGQLLRLAFCNPPPLTQGSHKNATYFCGRLQGSLFFMSSRTRNAVEWRDPPASVGSGAIPHARLRLGNFAPLRLVRRFVGMLLQAGISPCVGRNDGGGTSLNEGGGKCSI